MNPCLASCLLLLCCLLDQGTYNYGGPSIHQALRLAMLVMITQRGFEQGFAANMNEHILTNLTGYHIASCFKGSRVHSLTTWKQRHSISSTTNKDPVQRATVQSRCSRSGVSGIPCPLFCSPMCCASNQNVGGLIKSPFPWPRSRTFSFIKRV
ncbi:hypothetical protein BX600DRAFT_231658 [Xylariales sp. PMI_506]|nr:hypothetical protein BX600DRAFT_231658 [Xylariales sp. PMI_506]